MPAIEPLASSPLALSPLTPGVPPPTPPPPLVTTDAFKRYARIETETEDDLIHDLLVEVVGLIETFVGVSLTTERVTWYDDAQSWRLYEGARALILPTKYVDPTTVVVQDAQGTVVDPTTYTVRLDQRLIAGIATIPMMWSAWNDGFWFGVGPYTIQCTAGFGTAPDYATRWLPRLRALINDYCQFLYQQRSPGAVRESSAGTSVLYGEIDPDTGLPVRIMAAMRKLRGPVF